MSRSRVSADPDFRRLFEAAPGLYLVLAPDLTILAASDAYLAATMTHRDEIVGRRLFDVFPDNPDDPAATGVANLRGSLERVLAQGLPDAMAVQKYDVQRPSENGGGFEERFWSPVNSPVFGDDGRVAYIIHRVEDVTEFVRLKQEGRAQHQLAAELQSRAGSMEAEIYRRAQQIQEANRELRELQGDLERRVEQRTADLSSANAELEREISERRKAEDALRHSEEQLRQAQKLEAIGRLAGGIAHDFNNLLSVILSYSELLLARGAPGTDGRAELEEIREAGERAAKLTHQLLAFSRQQVLAPQSLDLNDVVRGLHSMLERLLGEDVQLRLRLATGLGAVLADRGQIEQVIMNLVVNSRDAMPTGGTLTIETDDIRLDEAYAREHIGVEPGPYVLLAVSDTGVGMDRATRQRMFEPFFTTKEMGKGTGLGLSTVFGIVKQSGGSVWVYSEPGLGATFKIYLPRHAGDVERTAAPVPLVTARGSETILLVEDEPQVRGLAIAILNRAGYTVLPASSPTEAIDLARRSEGIDLLLTDVVMPGMNGRELADRIRSERPGLRVLFMSGYTDDVILHHGVLAPGVAFLQKPLTPDSLTRKLRQALEAPAGPTPDGLGR